MSESESDTVRNNKETVEQTSNTKTKDEIPRHLRTRYWNSWEDMKLVETWYRYFDEVEAANRGRNGPIFVKISMAMKEAGFYLNSQECRRRLNTLRNKYLSEKQRLHNAEEEEPKSDLRVYQLLKSLLERDQKQHDPNVELNTVQRFLSTLPPLTPEEVAQEKQKSQLVIENLQQAQRNVRTRGRPRNTHALSATILAINEETKPAIAIEQQTAAAAIKTETMENSKTPTAAQTQQLKTCISNMIKDIGYFVAPRLAATVKQENNVDGGHHVQAASPSAVMTNGYSHSSTTNATSHTANSNYKAPNRASMRKVARRFPHNLIYPRLQDLRLENERLMERRNEDLKQLILSEQEVILLEQLAKKMQQELEQKLKEIS